MWSSGMEIVVCFPSGERTDIDMVWIDSSKKFSPVVSISIAIGSSVSMNSLEILFRSSRLKIGVKLNPDSFLIP